MTCKRITSLTLVLAAALAGCGNYSNEDLEYMNAVPDRDDLAANIPASRLLVNEAELSKTTHEVVATFNGLLNLFLGIVDTVRTYPPTRRLPNQRIWGPVPAEESRAGNGGSSSRAIRPRPRISPTRWSSSASAPRRTPGPCCSAGGSRRRAGRAAVSVAFTSRPPSCAKPATRSTTAASGSTTIDVTYSTREFPISVVVDFVQFSDLTFTTSNTFHYEYGAQENGQGAMRFVITGADLIRGRWSTAWRSRPAGWLRRRPRRGHGDAGRCGGWAHAGGVLGYQFPGDL